MPSNPAGCGDMIHSVRCDWEWDGSNWVIVRDDCWRFPCFVCPEPPYSGSFQGEQATMDCTGAP